MDEWFKKYKKVFIILGVVFSIGFVYSLGEAEGYDRGAKETKTQSNEQSRVSEPKTEIVSEEPAQKKYENGTYEVGVDIEKGKYISKSDDCYWAISKDSNKNDIISSDLQSGQQIVTLDQDGTFFDVKRCSFTKS